MLVRDLIKELEKLPQDASIGINNFNSEYGINELYDSISICTIEEDIYNDVDNGFKAYGDKCNYYLE